MFPPFHPFIHSILQYFMQHLLPATSIGTIPKYEPITLMRHLQHKVMFSAVLSPDKEFKGDPAPWFCSCPVERQRLIATAKLLCTVRVPDASGQILLTLDLYHSSASWRFLAATLSYCWRTSRRAAVRSGLETSISIWMCCSWSWACSSRISLEKQTLGVITQQHTEHRQVGTLGHNQWRAYSVNRLSASNHRPHDSAYLIMKLLQEDNLLLQRLNFALQIKTCQRGIVNILTREKND